MLNALPHSLNCGGIIDEEKEDNELQTDQTETVHTESLVSNEEKNTSTETNIRTTTTVEGFPFSEIEETPHYFDNTMEFDIKDIGTETIIRSCQTSVILRSGTDSHIGC